MQKKCGVRVDSFEICTGSSDSFAKRTIEASRSIYPRQQLRGCRERVDNRLESQIGCVGDSNVLGSDNTRSAGGIGTVDGQRRHHLARLVLMFFISPTKPHSSLNWAG